MRAIGLFLVRFTTTDCYEVRCGLQALDILKNQQHGGPSDRLLDAVHSLSSLPRKGNLKGSAILAKLGIKGIREMCSGCCPRNVFSQQTYPRKAAQSLLKFRTKPAQTRMQSTTPTNEHYICNPSFRRLSCRQLFELALAVPLFF